MATTSASVTTTLINQDQGQNERLDTGGIVGMVIGLVFLVGALVVLLTVVVFVVIRKRREKTPTTPTVFANRNGHRKERVLCGGKSQDTICM